MTSPEDLTGEYSTDSDDQLTQEDALIDRGVDDLLDEGYSPPDQWQPVKEDETLTQRLNDEVPDVQPDPGPADEQTGNEEIGTVRSGRLVAPDEGTGPDTEKDLIGAEVGIDGGAASAEEAAVHVVDEDADPVDTLETTAQVNDDAADSVVDQALDDLEDDDLPTR